MPKSESWKLSARRVGVLYLLFFLICLGLGYPILNRIDWHSMPQAAWSIFSNTPDS